MADMADKYLYTLYYVKSFIARLGTAAKPKKRQNSNKEFACFGIFFCSLFLMSKFLKNCLLLIITSAIFVVTPNNL